MEAGATPPMKYLKRCPECSKMFVKGRRGTHCDTCRDKLKAWRKHLRNEVRRAKLGLHPGWRTPKLQIPRKRPTERTRSRYETRTCCDCIASFTAGKNALRCIECNQRHRREYCKKRDAKRGPRDGRRRGTTDAATLDATRTRQSNAPHTDATKVATNRRGT
jgi:hypothetical protein